MSGGRLPTSVSPPPSGVHAQGLYLLDGYSVIYRGYFAFLRRPLLSPSGRNVSSVFVFFRTLLQLVKDRSPGMLAVAMDSRTPTFRHERYPAYKANREKAPEDLHAQVPVIEEILAALRVPCVRADGFEADDVIATLAERCRSTGQPCWILSGDKDILQLIGGNVRLLAQEKGSTALEEYTRERVLELRGIYPERIVDYLALAGDASDNVPGVAGIGEKTAVKLLSRFEGLDDLYARLDEVTPEGVRKKLAEGRADAMLSRELVILRRDVPGLPDLPALSFDALDAAAAVPLFAREGMRSIVEELGAPARARSAAPAAEASAGAAMAPAVDDRPSTAPGTYPCVTDLAELDRRIADARAAGVYAFDVETDSTDEMRAVPLGFSLSCAAGQACYIPIRAAGVQCLPEKVVKERLRGLLEDPSVRLVGQNVKYDAKVMRRWVVRFANAHLDTMLAAWVLDSDQGAYGLDRLAGQHLGYRTLPYDEVVEKGKTLADVPVQRAADYSGEDADLTFRLHGLLGARLDREGLAGVLHDIEMPLVEVLTDMELAGIRVLTTELAAYSAEMERSLAALEEEIYALAGRRFNINSTKQLQEILFTWRKLEPVRRTRTGFSTDMDVLEALARQDPVPERILAHRKLAKLKSTYVDSLPRLVNEDTGRVHTHYVQTGTATGRLSSKDPNLQNIPVREEEGRRIRRAFVPEPGSVFVSADYAQVELAILAYLSGDPTLLGAFKAGKDVHRETAALIFGVAEDAVTPEMRRVGKTINFGVVYGMTAFGLSQSLKIGRAEANRFIQTYFERFEGVDRWLKDTIRSAGQKGYVETLSGRRRSVPAIRSANRTERTAAERVAVNSPIQGTAADLIKIAMVRLARRLRDERLPARLLLSVHDEIVLEAEEGAAERVAAVAKETMEGASEHPIPLAVHVEQGDSWGAFH
ncbi:MAG: DNA polymerase I [Spirochaetes bacterium]|nr:DNA polymerase I [Spirochaetota bacterium]